MECAVCTRSFSEVAPFAFRGCRHTACARCISQMDGTLGDQKCFKCYKCRQLTYYVNLEDRPFIQNMDLEYLAKFPEPPRCEECGEFFGENRVPVFTGFHQKRNYCGDSMCRQCFDAGVQKKLLFCRGCCLPIKIPGSTFVPVKNYQLLDAVVELSQAPGNGPETEEERKRQSDKKTKKDLGDYITVLRYFCHNALQVVPEAKEVKLLMNFLARLTFLNSTDRLDWADRESIIMQVPDPVEFRKMDVENMSRHPDNVLCLAQMILRQQAQLAPHLKVELDPGVPGWP